MVLYVTYCSKDKAEASGKIPSISRYQSDRIEKVYTDSQEKDQNFAILSGKYGLLKPQEKIPLYDKLLKQEDLDEMIPKVSRQLQTVQPSKVVYFTREVKDQRRPYFKLMREACEREDIEFEKKVIE